MSKNVRVRDASVIEGHEIEVIISDGDKPAKRIKIHPWDRKDWPIPREVYVGLGNLTKKGRGKADDEYQTAIFDRDDFVEGLLAVFPELTRA